MLMITESVEVSKLESKKVGAKNFLILQDSSQNFKKNKVSRLPTEWWMSPGAVFFSYYAAIDE